MHSISNPVSHIGIIGGGQLGRMMVMAARRMGCAVSVIDPTPDSPAGQLADQQVVAAFDDIQAMRSVVECCDVTTFEIETIDVSELINMEQAGHAIYPSPNLLRKLQDKLLQKQMLDEAGLPTAPFVEVKTISPKSFSDFGYPLVQKARRGGYDGRGVAVLQSTLDYDKRLRVSSYIERFVKAKKELSVLVARDRKGTSVCYPVVEMWVRQEQNVLDMLLAPALISDLIAKQATEIARKAIDVFEGVGIFGVELFLTENDEILINEIAPRTHNSGHHTIEACVTDQFEQHLRAVMGLPLGSVEQLYPSVMVNLLGEPTANGMSKVEGLHEALKIEGASVHIYGKHMVKPYRKMGHVTIVDQDVDQAKIKAQKAREIMSITAQTT